MSHRLPNTRCLLLAIACLLANTPAVQAGPPVEAAAVEAAPSGFLANAAWVCRRVKLRCQTSNAGKLLTNAIRPISKLTGGVIPVPNDNHFAGAVELHASKPVGMAPGATPKPPPPPPPGVAAAAMIKKEKGQAKIRREAVAYLAGLDCRYYPEAEAALIASLRADRDECVRWEAAKALMSGCCCTPAVTKALTVCVTGSCEDGNPSERSTRVRRTALAALQKCQQCSPSAAPAARPEAPLGSDTPEQATVPVSYNMPATYPVATPTASPSALDLIDNLAAPPESGGSLMDLWRRSAK